MEEDRRAIFDFGAGAAPDAAMTTALRGSDTRLGERGGALPHATNLRELNQLREDPRPAGSTESAVRGEPGIRTACRYLIKQSPLPRGPAVVLAWIDPLEQDHRIDFGGTP
jgi:hypothetical protein